MYPNTLQTRQLRNVSALPSQGSNPDSSTVQSAIQLLHSLSYGRYNYSYITFRSNSFSCNQLLPATVTENMHRLCFRGWVITCLRLGFSCMPRRIIRDSFEFEQGVFILTNLNREGCAREAFSNNLESLALSRHLSVRQRKREDRCGDGRSVCRSQDLPDTAYKQPYPPNVCCCFIDILNCMLRTAWRLQSHDTTVHLLCISLSCLTSRKHTVLSGISDDENEREKEKEETEQHKSSSRHFMCRGWKSIHF